MRLSGVMDADEGVAVAALDFQPERQLERGSPIAFADHVRGRREHCRQRPRELGTEPGRAPVWRVEEDEIVLTARRACVAKECARVLAVHHGALNRQGAQVVIDRADRARGAVDERRLAAPRESASIPSAPEPANRSSTRAPSSGPSSENSASRTRSDVGRVAAPRGAASRRPP